MINSITYSTIFSHVSTTDILDAATGFFIARNQIFARIFCATYGKLPLIWHHYTTKILSHHFWFDLCKGLTPGFFSSEMEKFENTLHDVGIFVILPNYYIRKTMMFKWICFRTFYTFTQFECKKLMLHFISGQGKDLLRSLSKFCDTTL